MQGRPSTETQSIETEKKLAPESNVVEIAVADFDNCAASIGKSNAKVFLSPQWKSFISPLLVKHIKERKATELYGCTHRCVLNDILNISNPYLMAEGIKQKVAHFKSQFNYYKRHDGKLSANDYYRKIYLAKFNDGNEMPTLPDLIGVDSRDQFTTRIIENLAAAIGIPWIEVSTPDDANAPKGTEPCGSGFRALLVPYEKELAKIFAEQKEGFGALSEEEYARLEAIFEKLIEEAKSQIKIPDSSGRHYPVADYDSSTKEEQLLQIAKHAAKRHPGKLIVLNYYDDSKKVLRAACNIDPRKLPPGVTLNIFEHDAFDQSAPIKLLKTIVSTAPRVVVTEKKETPVEKITTPAPLSPTGLEVKSPAKKSTDMKAIMHFLRTYKNDVDDPKWNKYSIKKKFWKGKQPPTRIMQSRAVLSDLTEQELQGEEKSVDQEKITAKFAAVKALIDKPKSKSRLRKGIALFFQQKREELVKLEQEQLGLVQKQ